jgi:hypothetical protein
MKRVLSVSIFLTFFVLSSFLPALCQTRTIWEIGKYDQSAAEFKASRGDHVVYQVGKSDWAQDWRCNAVEDNLRELHVADNNLIHLMIHPHEELTVRFMP